MCHHLKKVDSEHLKPIRSAPAGRGPAAAMPTSAHLPALQLTPTRGTPLSVAAFKRLLVPGDQYACVYRPGFERTRPATTRVVEVLRLQSRDAVFTDPNHPSGPRKSYLSYPTAKNGHALESFPGGFTLVISDDQAITYVRLSEEAKLKPSAEEPQ